MISPTARTRVDSRGKNAFLPENQYVSCVSTSIPARSATSGSGFPSEEFIESLRQKDRKAFEVLYDKYSGALYGLAMKILKNDNWAEDILQETFVRVYRKIHTYDPIKGRLFTWMLNIARNLSIDMLRSREFQMTAGSVVLETEQLEQVVPASNMAVDHIGLNEVLDSLPASQKEVIKLLYYKGFTQVEVAKQMDIPLGTVKSKVRLGMGALRKKMLEVKGGQA